MPKSTIFTTSSPSGVRCKKTFSGFMSRCTTPWRVRRGEGAADLERDAQAAVRLDHAGTLDLVREVVALEELHREVKAAIFRAGRSRRRRARSGA